MPYNPFDPMPLVYEEDPFALPQDPLRAANRYGRGLAGLALLSTAGSRNYGSNLAQALQAYLGGRNSRLSEYRDISEQQAINQAKQETLRRQAEAEARRAETERRMAEKYDREFAAEDRKYASEIGERATLWAAIPEAERHRYSKDFTDIETLRNAAYGSEDEPKALKDDLGDRIVYRDPETYEEIISVPKGARPSAAGSGQSSPWAHIERVHVGDRIQWRHKATGEVLREVSIRDRPRGLTAGQWLSALDASDPAEAIRLAEEAERRARVLPPSVERGGSGIPVDEEALGLSDPGARVSIAPRQSPLGSTAPSAPSAGSSSTAPSARSGPAAAPGATSQQEAAVNAVKAALAQPGASRDTVKAGLLARGVPASVADQLLDLAGAQ